MLLRYIAHPLDAIRAFWKKCSNEIQEASRLTKTVRYKNANE